MSTPDKLAEALLAFLPAEREQKNRRALAVLLPAMGGGDIYNSEFLDAKMALDRSFEKVFNDIVRTDYTTHWEPGSNGRDVSARGIVSNELGHVSGLRDSIAKAKKVAKLKVTASNLAPLRALLAAAVPFAELMEKLKTKAIKGRRPAAGGSRKDRQIAARAGGSGECQICSGSWALMKAKISLHGYQRPGIGFIEGRCMGAQELPYEVSCEVLRKYIGTLKRMLSRSLDELTDIQVATEIRAEKNVWKDGRHQLEMRTFKQGDPNFEGERDVKKREIEYRIRELNTEIAMQEKRLAAWVPKIA